MEPDPSLNRNNPILQQVRKGSTPLLLLSVLADGEMHGYQMMREMAARSEGYFTMTAALLYPTLHQMEQDGLLASRWEGEEGKRRRKVYSITSKGHRALVESRADWQGFIQALNKTLEGGRA
jgi:PadR family transcriptional regulator, regulatory protein PadR